MKYFPSSFLNACYRSRFDKKHIGGHPASLENSLEFHDRLREQLTTPSGGMLSECQFPKLKSGFWIHSCQNREEDLKNNIFGTGVMPMVTVLYSREHLPWYP